METSMRYTMFHCQSLGRAFKVSRSYYSWCPVLKRKDNMEKNNNNIIINFHYMLLEKDADNGEGTSEHL